MSWGPMEKLEFVLIVSLVVFLCAVGVILATLLHFERRKRIRFRNNSSPSMMREFGGEMFPPQSSGRSSEVPLTSRAEAVRFESPTGGSAFEVTIPSKKYMDAQAWQKLELSAQSRKWLSPFLDGASEALKLPLLAHLATTQTFRIIFDGAGELMRSKSGEGFRSILIDKNSHRVVSHGLLQQAGQGAANGLLLWECAAVIVGRKYLADIDRKLGRIDAGIADIRVFLENERVGKLQADCKLLGDAADALRRDPSFLFSNTALQHSIEAVEQNASAVVRACLLDLQSIRHALNQNISLKAVSDADLSPLSQAVSKAVHTLHAASFALSLRICCAAFLGSYMEDEHPRPQSDALHAQSPHRIDRCCSPRRNQPRNGRRHRERHSRGRQHTRIRIGDVIQLRFHKAHAHQRHQNSDHKPQPGLHHCPAHHQRHHGLALCSQAIRMPISLVRNATV